MNISESIRLALEGLRANKMRSLLTMLGIIIGIGSVIAILTVGNSMSSIVTDSMSSLGASNIMVMLQQKDSDAMNTRMRMPDESDRISDDMIDALVTRYSGSIVGVSVSEAGSSGKVELGRKYANVSITGVNEDYLDVNNVKLIYGRNISENDLDGTRGTCIVSNKLVGKLYDGDYEEAMGQEIQVRASNEIFVFRIVGIYEYEQTIMNMSFASEDDLSTELYAPITTIKRQNSAYDGYTNITVQAVGAVDSQAFAVDIAEYLNKFYASNTEYQVSAISMESITNQLNTMMSTISTALSVIAGISLLVGGIGVMNIMLVSVTERTREIGTRKAIGATNNNIRVQFVVESIIVCLIGGIIGVILGSGLGYFGAGLLGAASMPTVSAVALAVGFSMGIGIFFGYYPANKAAKLDPIEALRYE